VDRLEQQLRETLADDRLTLPVRPDATQLIQTGVRRRRRNRAIATVTSAVVLVAGGIAAASFVTGSGDSERIVPPTGGSKESTKPSQPRPTQTEVAWAALPYDYHHPPAFPGALADPTVPWCRADQLSLSQQFQGATGSWAGVVIVTNNSASACALQGQPGVSMLSADGKTLVASRQEPFYVDEWIRLSPTHNASAQVLWLPEFCNVNAPARVSVALPHAGGDLSTQMTGSPRCDVDTVVPMSGRLDVNGFRSSQVVPFTPQAGLLGSLDRVPTSTLPGAVVAFRLQLQSMRAPSVPLDPCLPYRERLVNHRTQVVLVEEDHLLNCDSDGAPQSIGDPQSRRSTYFDLRLAVPPSAPPGDYDLVWQSVLKPVNARADDVIHVQSGPPPCRDGQLIATDSKRGHWQAMNQYGHAIVLRNVSTAACTLRGYPGLRLVDIRGNTIGKDATRGDGYVFPDPGPTTVVLGPTSGTASFTFGGPAITGGGQTPCPTSTAAIVYPPGLRHQLRVDLVEPYCSGGLDVTAVVAGPGGAHY